MKNTLKVINYVLLGLALAAVGFGVFAFLQYRAVPTAAYEASAADLLAQAQTVDESTGQIEQDMKARQDALREDVSQSGDEGKALAAELAGALTDNGNKTAQLEELRAESERLDNIMEETLAKRREYAGKIRELEEKVQAGETDLRICYWTFDDGPTRLTSQVLDKAKELGVYVTFFTSNEANESDDEPEMLRREFAEGHAVANHTYSHQFAAMGNLYQNTDGLLEMIEKQDEWVYECTGFHTEIFRYPGGSAWAKALLGTDPTEAIRDAGYEWIEWSCDVFDNGVAGKTAAEIESMAVWQVKQLDIAVVLSHDWNANTLIAFPGAVKQLRAQTRFALTGTPVENRLGELWSIFSFLMPGYLPPYKSFCSRFEKPITLRAHLLSAMSLMALSVMESSMAPVAGACFLLITRKVHFSLLPETSLLRNDEATIFKLSVLTGDCMVKSSMKLWLPYTHRSLTNTRPAVAVGTLNDTLCMPGL